MQRKQLAPGVFLTALDAEKFNRCRIAIHLRYPAVRQSATDAAVLSMVLERGYAGCPDMTQLSRRLAALYGADLGVDLMTAGGDRVLSADICGIKQKFALADEDLVASYADIVFGTVFEPYLVGGSFDPEAVRIEKETLRRRLQSEYNDKRLYCVRQARRRFYGDSPAGIELYGYLNDIDAVTPQSVKAEYDRILSQASIDVIVQGADAEPVAQRLLAKLASVRRAPAGVTALSPVPAAPVRHYTEEIAGLTQAKLCMLFTRDKSGELPSIHVLRMAMGVFGGTATSRLFRNVREKQSLCYYCGSSALRAAGVMMVDSGVETANIEKAESAILKELSDLCARPVDEEELEQCRRTLLEGIDSVGDSLAGLAGWYYGQIMRGEPLTAPEEGKAEMRAVTPRQVQEILQSYSYSVCYALTGRGEEADA